MGNFNWMIVGFISGAAGVLIAMPDIQTKEDCQLFSVHKKAVTAYVLKPPVLEQAKCEAFCPTPLVKQPEPQVTPEPENVSQAETTKDDDSKQRRHRRHRYRRYWR